MAQSSATAQMPCKIRAELSFWAGSCHLGHMQTIPYPAKLSLHVYLKTKGVWASHARRRKWHGQAEPAVLHDNATSPVATYRVFLGISNVVLEDLSMNAVFELARQAMHEAKDMVPPPMYPWPLSQLPKKDSRGDTPLDAAKLPEEGCRNISHLLDVRQ